MLKELQGAKTACEARRLARRTGRIYAKSLFCIGLLILGLGSIRAVAQPVPLNGALGANFNSEYQNVNYQDLALAHVHWLRGFMVMTRVNPQNPARQLAISASLAAEQRGYHTILTLKWPFQRTGIPQFNSSAYKKTVEQLNAVLPLVMGKVDIIVIGNEPAWETPRNQWGKPLIDFYEAMADRIIAYRKTHCGASCRTRLFMGALNRLDHVSMRQAPWVNQWMAFVRATPEIEGVDIHPHVKSFAATRSYVQFVLQRMRSDQKFLVTEFSLVWYWKAHMHNRVPASFARQYGFPKKMKMWQAIQRAIKNRFSQQEWDVLLTRSPWFAAQSHYLDRAMALFRSTHRLAVACYGFEQGASMTRHFGPNSTPWLLNTVFARRTVRLGHSVKAPANPYWLASFKRLTKP